MQVKKGILNHFKKHYDNVDWKRPKIRGLELKRLNSVEKEGLEVDFCEDEIWEVLNS